MFCILLHRRVSGHNWTVHGWRPALTMKEVAMHRGIFGSAVFKVLWQDLEMREFAAKWMPQTGNEAQQWSWYETCHNRLEWFCREGDRLSWITAVSEMWVRTFEWELKSKALSVIIHIYYENANFGKINHRQRCWSFYMLFCVIPFHRVTLWRHSITSHFCSTTYFLCLVRSIQNWLKMLSCYATGHSADTVKNVLWQCRQEVVQYPGCSVDFIPYVCCLIVKLEQPLLWETVCKWRQHST